ncbi:transcriptional regulator [Longimycelium tulufanense]|uniref:Transcriptional regulator n=1 Tax=Longimycelium tulufanense TaxID=907463 RepID=A0A8J3CDF0_9PSEU|nr:transcriptional regulator [Longimycelium tulufanense]
MLRNVGRVSTVDAVIAELRTALTQGVWQVGDRIPAEVELARQLGVSRAPVREALRALVHVGVLEARQGDGTYVRTTADPMPMLDQMGRASARDAFEVQLAYDVQAARFAAERRTDQDLARLREMLQRRDEAVGAQEFADEDARFHLGVVEASHNPLLIECYRYFGHRLRDALYRLRMDRQVPESGPDPHHALVAAIAAGDPEGAALAARKAIEPSLNALNSLLPPRTR